MSLRGGVVLVGGCSLLFHWGIWYYTLKGERKNRLNVPMDHPSNLVEILERLCDLDDDMAGEVFAEVREPDDLVEELAAGAELEDEEVVLLGL